MGNVHVRILLLIIFLSSLLIFYQSQKHLYEYFPSKLADHLHKTNYSSIYENLVLLSCSSHSYTHVYCYYLPYVALAWRRIGFEPIVLLVGSNDLFEKLPLMNILRNELKIVYYFVDVNSSYSISVSQMIRLFGGFLPYKTNEIKDLFILTSDVDLLPISRHRFQLNRNTKNTILVVNAHCCPNAKFSYENFHNIVYYPLSYVGMTKSLWKKIFLPLNNCSISFPLTVNAIQCCLKDKMNVTLPINIKKPSPNWDLDQKFISLLIARIQQIDNVYVDKRKLGYRLHPNKNMLSSELNSILFYDDIHLPTKYENIMFRNRTWLVLKQAFSHLFNEKTLELLSIYHHQTTKFVLSNNCLKLACSISSNHKSSYD